MTRTENVHATGIVFDGRGLLIRGPSGTGKSLLALELLDRAAKSGLAALLVGDDRLDLSFTGEAVVMSGPANIAGLIELRGRGILVRPHVSGAPVDLVIDLVEALTRMPEAPEFTTEILGCEVPRCPVPRRGLVDGSHQILLVLAALAAPGLAGASGEEFT